MGGRAYDGNETQLSLGTSKKRPVTVIRSSFQCESE